MLMGLVVVYQTAGDGDSGDGADRGISRKGSIDDIKPPLFFSLTIPIDPSIGCLMR